MSETGGQQIWTREGRVSLNPEVSTLGITFEQRMTNLIDQYAVDASSGSSELYQATKDVYLRAYRRAGLLSGNADEIDTVLPVLEQPAVAVELDAASGFVESPPDSGCQPTDE